MKNLCKIIAPSTENEIFLPYYLLEQYCQNIVKEYLEDSEISEKERLERKKTYFLHQKNYKTFSPYFDFVFIKLGYILENPMLLLNTRLEWNKETEEYYVKYLGNSKELPVYYRISLGNPIFIEGCESNIVCNNLPENLEELPECFLDEDCHIIYLNNDFAFHNFWANMWIHQMLMSDKNFCLEYMKNVDEYGILERDSASFLMEFYPWMRLARIALNMHEETMLLVFNSLHASLKQKNLIHELQDKKLLLNRFLKDMND